MNEELNNELRETAYKVREKIIKMSGNGGCFIGASLSCVDILVYLYKNYMNISKDMLEEPERDYLFLSKGHDVPALYGVFAEIGFIDAQRLGNHLKTDDFIYWHPNRKIPGVEFHSGSLGHLISVAIGVAYDCKLRGTANKIIVILGDGELNEGSVWEAMLVAAAYKLDNIIAIVDRNRFQANMKTEKLLPLEPLERKFEAFGWNAATCDGHDFYQINEILINHPANLKRPFVLIAETVRGKGLPSIENRADRWFCNFSENEINDLLNELETKQQSILTSEILMVR